MKLTNLKLANLKLSNLVLPCVLISAFTVASSASFASMSDLPDQAIQINSDQTFNSISNLDLNLGSKFKGGLVYSTSNTNSQPQLSQVSYSGNVVSVDTNIQEFQSVQTTEKDALAVLIEQLDEKYPSTPVAIERSF